ncbi:hypothetical protein ASG41_04375 [Modestobacter sp. Leaf380]|nr:hypothetical protein ASG41_04375 [Modestobacter sp. Leaf380]
MWEVVAVPDRERTWPQCWALGLLLGFLATVAYHALLVFVLGEVFLWRRAVIWFISMSLIGTVAGRFPRRAGPWRRG